MQIESSTEVTMLNAAYVLREKISTYNRIPSDQHLQTLRDQLGISHVFIINNKGKFIRSTNEDPSLIPNLFSFCADYKNLTNIQTALERFEVTPIIPPMPEPNPYKFLMVATKDKKYIIEVGYKAEFIGNALAKAAASDKNIESIELSTPDGINLGIYGNNAVAYDRANPTVLINANTAKEVQSIVKSRIVAASNEHCCQCKKSGLSRNGKYYYILKTRISTIPLKAAIDKLFRMILLVGCISLVVSLVLSKWLSSKLSARLCHLTEFTNIIISRDDSKIELPVSGNDEISELAKAFNRLLQRLRESAEVKLDYEKHKYAADVAAGVAHDIRSPLAALRMLTAKTDHLPEESRQLIQVISSRIQLIADTLLVRRKNDDSISNVIENKICLPYAVIESILAEKRILTNNTRISIDTYVQSNLYTVWAKISLESLGRIISNLVNNSIEAFETSFNKTNKYIKLSIVQHNKKFLRLSIEDNAGGIHNDIIALINDNIPCSTKISGNGLGLSNAKETLSKCGGQISIIAKPEIGTVINIDLPVSDIPKWCASKIVIPTSATVVVVDDDDSIHEIWRMRLPKSQSIAHYWSLLDLKNSKHFHNNNVILLIDYEMRKDNTNGLDFLIDESYKGIAYIVTSHVDDASIHSKSISGGWKIVPKFIAPFISINLESQSAIDSSSQYSAVLIDDDPLIRLTWESEAKHNGINLLGLSSYGEFLKNKIAKDTPIFIDYSLGDVSNDNGIDVGLKLHKSGYNNLHLATGFVDTDELKEVPHIFKSIQGKDYPSLLHT
jgi:signal transduction histidine kinase